MKPRVSSNLPLERSGVAVHLLVLDFPFIMQVNEADDVFIRALAASSAAILLMGATYIPISGTGRVK
jgi:hypothetical protein